MDLVLYDDRDVVSPQSRMYINPAAAGFCVSGPRTFADIRYEWQMVTRNTPGGTSEHPGLVSVNS